MKIINYLLIPALALALIAADAARLAHQKRECKASGGVLLRGVCGNECVTPNAPTKPAEIAAYLAGGPFGIVTSMWLHKRTIGRRREGERDPYA